MKTPRNKSFLSHLLGWINGEESDDTQQKWWQDGGGGGVGGFSFCLPVPLGAT